MNSSQAQESTLINVKSIIAISSCKGGVGKSTVAACLAQVLAEGGSRVGLLDADIYGPSVPTLFGLPNVEIAINAQKQFVPVEKNHLKLMSFGFLLGDAPAVMRGPMVTQYIQQILHRTAWGALDYLFIDMPPGTGDVQLTITQSVRLSGAVIVTTPQTLSLVDVARGILMFEKVSVPVLGVVENMAYFLCPGCAAKHQIFGQRIRSLQERFGVEILASWPLAEKFIHAISPEMVHDPVVQETAQRVVAALQKRGAGEGQIPKVEFDREKVTLIWTDGTRTSVSNRDLRLSCSCALCVDERSGKRLLQEKNIRADIAPRSVIPLGNYAIGIIWNDGHSSGIYPYNSIREMAQ